MELLTQPSQVSPSIYSDNSSLDRIRQQSMTDSPAAIKAAAKEFESFFMNMMLKSMRQASEVIGEESMMSSPQEKMFVGMLDNQMSVDLSQKGSLGIAELITRNLLPKKAEGFDLNGKRQAVNRLSINAAESNEKEKWFKPIDAGKNLVGMTSKILENTRGEESLIANVSQTNSLQARIVGEKNISKNISGVSSFSNDNVTVKKNISATSTTTSAATTLNPTPSKQSMFESVTSFVKELMPLANKAAEKIGLNPKMLLAQAALETGWGQHVIHDSKGQSSFNLFGIKDNKSWKGDSVKIGTLEVESGEFVQRQEKFRSYSSFENSFNDFVDFVSNNPRYDKAMSLVNDAEKFIQSIQDAGYATDPNYAKKIINIFNRNLDD